MSIRDVLVLGFVFGSVPVALINPYWGVLVWYIIALLNPHRYAWGIATHFPVAQVIAIPTLLGIILQNKFQRRFMTREMYLMLALLVWFGISLIHAMQVPAFAGHIASAQVKMLNVTKIILMTFVAAMLVDSPRRLRWLILICALSFGLIAVKGTIWGIGTEGQYRVYGPEGSFIADNNAMGVALNMSLPMLFFLTWDEENKYLRLLYRAMFVSGIFCVILTYSRGGLLGLAAVLLAILMKSRHKLLGLALGVAAAMLVLTFAPQKWMDRMGNFAHGKLDNSAEMRLITWQTGWNIAMDYPITGGGFDVYPDTSVYQHYEPRPLPGDHPSTGPHSIYFQMLGEQGFVGLGIYLTLMGSCFVSLMQIRRRARRIPELKWAVAYSHMLEVSILGFAVSGATLEFGNFDFYYLVVAMTAIIRILLQQELAARGSQPAAQSAEVDALEPATV